MGKVGLFPMASYRAGILTSPPPCGGAGSWARVAVWEHEMEAGLFRSLTHDERVSTPSQGQSLPQEEHGQLRGLGEGQC